MFGDCYDELMRPSLNVALHFFGRHPSSSFLILPHPYYHVPKPASICTAEVVNTERMLSAVLKH